MKRTATGLALAGALLAGVAPAAAAPAAADCTPWRVDVVASGLGILENLAFDGRGRLLVSASTPAGGGSLSSLTPDGRTDTVVAEVPAPGGIVVDEGTAFFTTGNGTVSGLLGRTDGTLEAVDLDTGDRRIVAAGLTMPNGLVRLPGGDFLVSRNLSSPPGLTRVPVDGRAPRTLRTDLGSVNGLAVDGETVYAATTFDPTTRIHALDADDLDGPVRTLDPSGPGPLETADDLDVGPDGALYVPLNVAGRILRVDPVTGAGCTIATGVPFVSAVAFGDGPGWDPEVLYTTGFDGSVHAVRPVRGSGEAS
ncbi:SMP-30/gluconolactonase/LRE family protein [Rhodococcus indonesiensis]|uniref:SMP-30/gluconolactonase/LRE family protein n=1 Tax=Rhodococcus indonesiensis TaxID=3055869 RepID=UPI0039F6A202